MGIGIRQFQNQLQAMVHPVTFGDTVQLVSVTQGSAHTCGIWSAITTQSDDAWLAQSESLVQRIAALVQSQSEQIQDVYRIETDIPAFQHACVVIVVSLRRGVHVDLEVRMLEQTSVATPVLQAV